MNPPKFLEPVSYIRALVRPLVRWCLKRGVRSAQVEEAVRECFVHEAESQLREAQGALSVSKVSVMTGLHRVETARLLAGERPDRGAHDILNRVLGMWSTSKRYRTPDGKPRELTHEGVSSEFARLVADVSKEVTHYPILFELERIGAIEYSGRLVHLRSREYIPQKDLEYALRLLSDDIADLSSAIESNVTGDADIPSLHLRTEYDNIDPKYLPEIRAWILRQGAEFHSRMRDFLSGFDRDTSDINTEDGSRARVSVTAFSFAEQIKAPTAVLPRKRGRKKCS